MNIFNVLRVVAVFFISITAILLVLAIFDVIDSEATKEALTKLALVSAVIGGASIAITFVTKR